MPKYQVDDMGNRRDLILGTLKAIISEGASRGDRHGYTIAQPISAASKETLHLEEGAEYLALHLLELCGMLDSKSGTSDAHRRVHLYRLTPDRASISLLSGSTGDR
jgi:DNA-binding PadR family transcriptional regulator